MWRGKAGTDQGTTIMDRGCGNSRRLPLQTAVDGIPREAWKRAILPHLPGNRAAPVPVPTTAAQRAHTGASTHRLDGYTETARPSSAVTISVTVRMGLALRVAPVRCRGHIISYTRGGSSLLRALPSAGSTWVIDVIEPVIASA